MKSIRILLVLIAFLSNLGSSAGAEQLVAGKELSCLLAQSEVVTQSEVSSTMQNEENISPLQRNGKPHFALILAGGGARGAAHIGVLKVLEREGLRPDIVCGSSVGAIIGALYCAGVPVARIESLMLERKIAKALMPLPIQIQTILYAPTYTTMRLLRLKPSIGLYRGTSIAKFINKNMPPSIKRIEDMSIPFAVIATNLLDTRPLWIGEGNVGEAVRASTTMPFVYKPCTIDDKVLVDGGVRNNLPTDPARAAGAEVIVAVQLHSSLGAKKEKELRTLLGYSDRIMSMLMAEIESKNIGDADILIEPKIKDDQLYAFRYESMKQAIDAGETAATKLLPEIRQRIQLAKKIAPQKRKDDL